MNRRIFVNHTSMAFAATFLPGYVFASFGRSKKIGYFNGLENEVLAFLETLRYKQEGWGWFKYSTLMPRNYSLESSSMAIGVMSRLGYLEKVSFDQKKEAIDFFLSSRDETDGFLKSSTGHSCGS